MGRASVRGFCILAACLATISCQRLDATMCPKPEPGAVIATGPLAFEPAALAEAIPEDYGTPIGVTQDPARPQWVGLWFQKPDKSITAVFVDMKQGKLSDKVFTIPRK